MSAQPPTPVGGQDSPFYPNTQEYVPIAGPYSEEEKWMIDRVAADLDAAGVGYVVRDEPGEVIGAARHFTIYRATKGLQTMEQTAALQKPMPELSDG